MWRKTGGSCGKRDLRSYVKSKTPDKHLHQLDQNIHIATDKVLYSSKKMLIFFLFLNKNICCGYSLEAPRQGAFNEYPQHMYSSRKKKNIMWIPPLICSYASLSLDVFFKIIVDWDIKLVRLNKLRCHTHF